MKAAAEVLPIHQTCSPFRTEVVHSVAEDIQDTSGGGASAVNLPGKVRVHKR